MIITEKTKHAPLQHYKHFTLLNGWDILEAEDMKFLHGSLLFTKLSFQEKNHQCLSYETQQIKIKQQSRIFGKRSETFDLKDCSWCTALIIKQYR